jgi:hypothetical protein
MKSAVLVLSVLFLIALIGFAAPQQSPRIEVPQLPTERDQFGGRPGSFHFVTNEQTMADAAEMKDAFAALDRLDSNIATLQAKDRDRFANDAKLLRTFATNVHNGRHTSAGETASEIEARLNASKGKFMCGACHGPGGMRGMHMGPGPHGN